MDTIYARQSVDRADSISIESQIEFCRYEARGGEVKTYIDRGYSGKNTQRPAFREMMEDMKRGLIGKVIVYKLDRISRSILDFSSMMDVFGKYGVEFVSTTEKFDTFSPMGRAMLNICIVFAQLERETIQKRVADAYFSRSQKSLYMGGRVPFGYRLSPAVVGGGKTSMYEVVPEEGEIVRLIYELYAQPECSYGDIVSYLHEHAVLKRGRPWERARVADLLRNPIYVRADLSVCRFYREQGAIVANGPEDFIGVNGCYYYKARDSSGRKQTALAGNHLVLAPHEGIVPADVWLRCRRKCLNARQVRPYHKAKNTWLAGKVKCGLCGYALVDKRYKGSPCRYLLCSHRMDAKACPGPGTLHTDELEELVWNELERKLALFPTLRPRHEPAASPERAALQVELTQIEGEIAALLGRLAQADDTLFGYINRRVEELDRKKREIQEKLSHRAGAETPGREITGYPARWPGLSFADKRRTVDLLVETIRADSSRVQIQWRV